MALVAMAWMYVVLMMAAAEAASPSGSLLAAVLMVFGYGLLPLALALYLLGTPGRRARRRAAEASAGLDPDGGGHAPGEPIPAKREEP